jgi:hypothetical protein
MLHPLLFEYRSSKTISKNSPWPRIGRMTDIADVTNFVLPNLPLDVEASQRGTSVYMVERRIDMLPKPLTEGSQYEVLDMSIILMWISSSTMTGCIYGLFLADLVLLCADICSLRADVERLAFSCIWVCREPCCEMLSHYFVSSTNDRFDSWDARDCSVVKFQTSCPFSFPLVLVCESRTYRYLLCNAQMSGHERWSRNWVSEVY